VKKLRKLLLTLGAVALIGAMFTGTAAIAAEPSPNAPVLSTPAGQSQPGEVSPLSPEQCAYGYYCAWKNESWTGSFWFWGEPKNKWFYVGSGANDQISSDWNRHQNATYANRDYSPGTYQFCISAGASHDDYGFSNYPQPPYPQVNDTISALYIQTSPC